MRKNCIWLLFAGLLLAGSTAFAGIIFDQNVDFTQTGTQFGRIGRDGNSSIWGEVKQFPGVTGAPAERAYQTFSIAVGWRNFLQISLDDPAAAFFDAAYAQSFMPVNAPPNYGLDVNSLGDPGLSQPLGVPSFFQIVAQPNSTVVISVN